MKTRLWALVQVLQYVGFDAMKAQIKREEIRPLYEWLRPGYANTHGLSQKDEMFCNVRYMEIVNIDRDRVRVIYDYLFSEIVKDL